MNTLKSHLEEFEKGLVTKLGYAAIMDAENYGAASSIGAGSNCIKTLWEALENGCTLSLYTRKGDSKTISSINEFNKWCLDNFPDCHEEHVRRSKH